MPIYPTVSIQGFQIHHKLIINQRHGTHFEMMGALHPTRLREMLTLT